jgi:hypothetical protein
MIMNRTTKLISVVINVANFVVKNKQQQTYRINRMMGLGAEGGKWGILCKKNIKS